MVDLSHCDQDELEKRLAHLYDDIDVILKKIGPEIETVGRMREECHLLLTELEKRNGEKKSKP